MSQKVTKSLSKAALLAMLDDMNTGERAEFLADNPAVPEWARERIARNDELAKRADDAYLASLRKAAPDPEAVYKARYAEFDAKLAEFSKANAGKGINAFLATPEGRELASACNEAHLALQDAEAAPQIADDAQENAYEALEKGLTTFCKSKGIAAVWTEGLDKFRNTDEGRQLSDNFNESH